MCNCHFILLSYCFILYLFIMHMLIALTLPAYSRIIVTVRTVCGTERCPSVCLFVRPIRPLQYSVRRVCCCGPGEWEISLDCCSSGVRMRAVTRCQRTMVAEQTRSYSASPKCENYGIGNENVPKITINNAIKLFSKTAMSIRVTSNRNSFRVLFDKIASVCFI